MHTAIGSQRDECPRTARLLRIYNKTTQHTVRNTALHASTTHRHMRISYVYWSSGLYWIMVKSSWPGGSSTMPVWWFVISNTRWKRGLSFQYERRKF